MKKFFYISLLLGSFFLSSYQFLHEYYVSITTVHINKEEKTIDLTFKFIAHDLEYAIENEKGISLHVDDTLSESFIDRTIQKYIIENFEISGFDIDGGIEMLGKQFELDETLYVYFTLRYSSLPNEIDITNTLLKQSYPDQENVTHITIDGEKHQSFSYKLSKTSHIFKTYE